jgi:hypothetical protein
MKLRMSRQIKTNNKGVASIIGIVFILLLVLTLASVLLLSLYSYDEKAQESIETEEERVQEKIVITSLSTENISGIEQLESLTINNTGTITTRIRAVYIDNEFICDPTDPSLNPQDTYINPKNSLDVKLPNNIVYEPFSKIEVATERGIKSIEYQWILRGGNQTDSNAEIQKVYFGPLLLDFDKFYYTEYDNYNDPAWKPGWSVENSIEVVWNITVTNIDDRDITINKFSSFTLVPNAEGAQRPWFLEPPNDSESLLIPSNTSVNLIYVWDGPQSGSSQSVFNQNQECRILMSFFGYFHQKDGTTKPYGQTIPFEAVLLRDPLMKISADPNVIVVDSSMTSTITVTARDIMGILAENEEVSFTTTNGVITPSAVTNENGIATATLRPGTTIGPAILTASTEIASISTTVDIVSGELVLERDPVTIATGSMTSQIMATVRVAGSPISGETVTFSTDATPTQGTLSSGSGITDGNGQATTIFTSGTDTGTVTITASWGLNTISTTVDIV